MDEINSVFALNDLTFLVLTTHGRYELWAIDTKEAKNATLVDTDKIEFISDVKNVCRIEDVFELDRHDMLKSRESISDAEVITEPETSEKVYQTAEMKDMYQDWIAKNGIFASDTDRENALTSNHRFAISSENGLSIFNFTLNYNLNFQTIVKSTFLCDRDVK